MPWAVTLWHNRAGVSSSRLSANQSTASIILDQWEGTRLAPVLPETGSSPPGRHHRNIFLGLRSVVQRERSPQSPGWPLRVCNTPSRGAGAGELELEILTVFTLWSNFLVRQVIKKTSLKGYFYNYQHYQCLFWRSNIWMVKHKYRNGTKEIVFFPFGLD